jgi:hypothetical protein
VRHSLVKPPRDILSAPTAGMRPEEASDFHEEDEDPARVFALFDDADKGRTDRGTG